MTVLGQNVGFAGRSVGSVVDGSGTSTDPWKFEFQSKDGGSSFVEVRDATGFYFDYVPITDPAKIPAGFSPNGSDLVFFRPCEALFQGFAGGPFPQGLKGNVWLIFGWVNYTFHYGGEEYPNTTDPYAILVDPEDANCYVLVNYQEIQKLASVSA